jgi:tetratricopeptide (TPR) repeat protein
MKRGSAKFFAFIRLIALAAPLWASAAPADEYSDVNQLIRAGKLSEAEARAERFLAAKPRDVQMQFIKAGIQRDTGRLAEATATFTRLTEEHPELPEPHNNLAAIYASQGQYEKARTELEMAIRTNPSYATAYENLGDIYAKLAGQAYCKALTIDGNNADTRAKLAGIRGQCQ